MKKKIALIVLVAALTGGTNMAYANTEDAINTSQTSEITSQPAVEESGTTTEDTTDNESEIKQEDISNSAGILPNSHFYKIERGIEKLQLSITKNEEEIAALKAKFATERAAEAVVMTNQGEDGLASKALDNYIELLSSATEHINNAIETKDKAVQKLEDLNEAYQKSEDILKTILEKAPEDSKLAIENALNEQDKAIAAVNGFYAAKNAFFSAKEQLEEAKKQLEEAKKSGDVALISSAEEKVKEAEALKDELEGLKDAANSSKEEIKKLSKQAEKEIKDGMKEIKKANDKIEKVEGKESDKKEKAIEGTKQTEEKAKKEEEKLREANKKAEEKAREDARKLQEKVKEEVKKTEEKVKKEGEKLKGEAQKTEEQKNY
ncbi:hypothetical protein UT300005_18030 [Clostridium sp. CTA-5]